MLTVQLQLVPVEYPLPTLPPGELALDELHFVVLLPWLLVVSLSAVVLPWVLEALALLVAPSAESPSEALAAKLASMQPVVGLLAPVLLPLVALVVPSAVALSPDFRLNTSVG